MANTNDRNLGPDKVEQGKNANEMFDGSDDINEAQPTADSKKPAKEIKQEDLDRGEELYTGFGFGAERKANPEAVVVLDDLETKQAAAANTVAVPTTSDSNPVDNSAANQKILTEENTKAANLAKAGGTAAINNENNTSKAPSADDRVKENSSAHKEVYTKEGNTLADQNNAKKLETTSIRTVETREVPTDTKLIIEPNQGQVDYIETTARGPVSDPANRTYYGVDEQIVGHHTNTIDQPSSDHYSGEVPADYELSDVYYTGQNNTHGLYSQTNQNYLTNRNNIDTISIKRHYKNQQKQNKKNIPWLPIAIGVGVVSALGYVFLGEDNDPFWK